MTVAETITIGGHEYEILGGQVVAERYDDGVELRIRCHSGLESPTVASFVRVGPRGGLTTISMGGDADRVREQALRLIDAQRHVAVVDRYRQETWGGGTPDE